MLRWYQGDASPSESVPRKAGVVFTAPSPVLPCVRWPSSGRNGRTGLKEMFSRSVKRSINSQEPKHALRVCTRELSRAGETIGLKRHWCGMGVSLLPRNSSRCDYVSLVWLGEWVCVCSFRACFSTEGHVFLNNSSISFRVHGLVN